MQRHLQGIVSTLDGCRAVIGTAKLLASYGAELTAAQAPAVHRWQDQGELWQAQVQHSCRVVKCFEAEYEHERQSAGC